jgi:AcrR family transcriptional regulator
LLTEARRLFADRGYEATRLRDVAAAVGVDAALIARYFGDKSGLHRAVLASEVMYSVGHDADSAADVVERVLAMWDQSGVGAGVYAFVTAGLDEDQRSQGTALTRDRLVTPLAAKLAAAGVADPGLRAEAIVAMLIGIGLVRATGSLPAVSAAPHDKLVALIAGPVGALGLDGTAQDGAVDGPRQETGTGAPSSSL